MLTDYRFVKRRNQLPRWIADETLHGQLDLSTDAVVGTARKFLRGVAQPLEIAQKAADGSLKGKDSWDLNELEVFQREQGEE